MVDESRSDPKGRAPITSPDRLRRYTSLPVALDMLLNNRITVVDYARWPDVNDRVGMREYQRTLHYGFVGAMCLTMAPETFHHWQVFAGDSAGVCVVFDAPRFLRMANGPHRICGPVEYVALDQIQDIDASDIHRLPFMKRIGFTDEAEFRLIGYSVEERPALHIALDPLAVQRIVISPFVHPELVASIRAVINGLTGWSRLPVKHSSLIDNQTWQRAIKAFPSRHGILYAPWLETEITFEDDHD